MKVWRNFITFLIVFLLITNPSYESRVVIEKRAVVKNVTQTSLDNSAEIHNSSTSGEGKEEVKVLPEALMQKTNDLLSDAVHMLNNIQDKSARRWLENFIFKISDLTTEMETTKAPNSLSELPYMPSSSSPLTSTNNQRGTAAESSNIIPIDDDTIKEQVVTKPGIPFFETDELVNQLHDQSNVKSQQAPNHTRLFSELSRMPFTSTDISSNQMFKESGLQHDENSGKQNTNKQNLQMVQEPSSDQGNVNAFQEPHVKNRENLGLLRHVENAKKRTSQTTSNFASQIREPLENMDDNYSKEKSLLLKSGFQKMHVLSPTREKWLLSHIYQQHAPYHRTISKLQNHYKNIPLKRYLTFGYSMIPQPQRKRMTVRPQRLRYVHYNGGGNPRLLKSINTHLRYPKLQEALLIKYDDALPHAKNSSHNELLQSNKTEIRKRINTKFSDFNQFEHIKNLSNKQLSPISKATKRFQPHSRRPNQILPNFSKRYLTSEYFPYYQRLAPRMLKKQSRVNSFPFDNTVGRSEIAHIAPALTDIEMQLRAGKVVILSDSLVRTNFEKHPKKSGKIATKLG